MRMLILPATERSSRDSSWQVSSLCEASRGNDGNSNSGTSSVGVLTVRSRSALASLTSTASPASVLRGTLLAPLADEHSQVNIAGRDSNCARSGVTSTAEMTPVRSYASTEVAGGSTDRFATRTPWWWIAVTLFVTTAPRTLRPPTWLEYAKLTFWW